MKIQPTVARMVWYRPGHSDVLSKALHNEQPLAAQIAHVHEDGTINIGVLDPEGNHHARQRVRLVQQDEPIDPGVSFCVWMPYQVGQARAQSDAGNNAAPPAPGS